MSSPPPVIPKVSVMMPVLAREAWQMDMTVCAISTLRRTTKLPFELVLAVRGNQAELETLLCERKLRDAVDVVVNCDEAGQQSPNADCNLGLAACANDAQYVVYTGNDVFTRPDWLRALLTCFEKFPDCGIATCASSDLPHCAKMAPMDWISEGVYGPFMMFPAGYRFDAETFPTCWGDTDLIQRIYLSGKRSYRNWNVMVQHLLRQSTDRAKNEADGKAAKERFIQKYGRSPLLITRVLIEGFVV